MPHEGIGSTVFRAVDIAERALRMIGAYAINDSAADESDVQESLWWLDMMIAYVGGIEDRFWLRKDEQSFQLIDGDQDYNLAQELPLLVTGVQFPVMAMLEDANGQRTPIDIVSQKVFRARADTTRTGTPERIYIDRLNDPVLYTDPIPDTTAATYKIVLVLQTFHQSTKPRGVTGTSGIGNEQTGLRTSWNLWAATSLSAYIGNGPVRALPLERVKDYRDTAKNMLDELEAYENRTHDSSAPFTEASIYS